MKNVNKSWQPLQKIFYERMQQSYRPVRLYNRRNRLLCFSRAAADAKGGMTVIQVEGIKKIYRVDKERIIALGGVSLQVQEGEICCILGSSGSGKSTLLNIMAGLEKPSRGKILLAGEDVTHFSERRWAQFRQKNIGFVFQSYNLLPTLSALENVALPLVFRGIEKDLRIREAAKMLRAVGLGSRMAHRPSQMSGGQQQRVGIARAFVSHPKIVFADEPTGNLDSKTSDEVMRIMVGLARRYHETLVLVTHDREIAAYGDRLIEIHDGFVRYDSRQASAQKAGPLLPQERKAAT